MTLGAFPLATFPLPAFLGRLRVLFGIDRDELVAAGAMRPGDGEAWRAFRADPPRWLLEADDERQRRVWRIVEGRA